MIYFAPRPLLGLLAAATATLACAADAVPRTYNIPAGPLNAVIARFSVESGVYVAADGALTGNKTSPGVQATLAPHDALTRLLAGSGLEAVPQGAGRYILRQGAAPQAAARTGVSAAAPLPSLPAVTVSGERETALGHVDGYVARRSATATKTDSRLIDNPQSVSVVTADELADRKVETLDEALRYTAGVTPNMKPWAVDEFSMLRGFELGTAGITSPGDFVESGFGDELSRALDKGFSDHVPEVVWTDNMHQGYVRVDLRRDEAEATFIAIDTIRSRAFRPFIVNRFAIVRDGKGIRFA